MLLQCQVYGASRVVAMASLKITPLVFLPCLAWIPHLSVLIIVISSLSKSEKLSAHEQDLLQQDLLPFASPGSLG